MRPHSAAWRRNSSDRFIAYLVEAAYTLSDKFKGSFTVPAFLNKDMLRDVPAPAVHGPKTLQNSLGSSRFGRSKSAPIVHGKHAGTVALPHRCRAASADTAAMLFWVWLASGPIKMRKDSAGGRAKTGNRAKSQNAAKQTPAFIEGVRIIRA
jgi:hypothetical protein